MDVARLNFSHGSPASRAAAATEVRASASAAGHPVAILADLAGPKIRLGELAGGMIDLEAGRRFTLATRGRGTPGGVAGATVSYRRLVLMSGPATASSSPTVPRSFASTSSTTIRSTPR